MTIAKRPALCMLWRAALLLLGAALCAQALVVMLCWGQRHLGVVLPLCLGLALMAWCWQQARWQAWLAQSLWRRRAYRAALAALALWLISLGAFFALLRQTDHATPSGRKPVAIVVLGSGAPHCRPSDVLRSRLRLTLHWAQELEQAPVLVCGGKDLFADCTEAAVMQDWLQQQGLPAARIMQENRSSSTAENLQWGRLVLAAHAIAADQPLLIITSDFHQLRARRIALRAGLSDVASAGAPTAPFLRYNAQLREYFAYISGYLLGEY